MGGGIRWIAIASSDAAFQAIRDACWEKLTAKQKEFLSLPDFAEMSNQYLITHQGARAWLAASGKAIRLVTIQTDEAERGKGQASQL